MNKKNKFLFISDLHLDTLRKDISENFSRFIQHCLQQQENIDSIYILGDLFDFWFGDDASIPLYQEIIQQLKQLTSAGISLFVMHGNRDFLIGKVFENATGSQLIDDPYLLNIDNEKVLLSHGDQLCTDDIEYQQFRKAVRNPETIDNYLQKPIQERIAIANAIKAESKKSGQGKTMEIMDVNQQAVESLMSEYQIRTLIHGHTHRPDVHHFKLGDNQTAKRYVLSDWDKQGSFLEWNGMELKPLKSF
jgi:UDP-2,3-diacylglucosamine hydrolase